MRATAKLLGWCVAVGLTLTVSSVQAGQHPLVSGTQLSWMATGQLASGSNSENRRLAEQWLRQSREAMEQDNLELAEYYIERAEKLNVKYDPILAQFKDTPEKVRKDLDAKRAAGDKASPKTGSAFSKLFPKKDSAPPSDQYGGSPAGSRLTDSSSFPVAAGNATASGGTFPAPTASQSGPSPAGQSKSQQLLLAARQALSNGDANKATLLTGQAKQLGLTYPLHADSPEKVETLIRKAQGFAAGPGPQTDSVTYTREFAQFLMDQATGLMQYKSFEDAQRLAQQAKDLRLSTDSLIGRLIRY